MVNYLSDKKRIFIKRTLHFSILSVVIGNKLDLVELWSKVKINFRTFQNNPE